MVFGVAEGCVTCPATRRWLHAACNSLLTEEEVEQAADEGFDCSACQPYVVKPAGERPGAACGDWGTFGEHGDSPLHLLFPLQCPRLPRRSLPSRPKSRVRAGQ